MRFIGEILRSLYVVHYFYEINQVDLSISIDIAHENLCRKMNEKAFK